MIADIKESQEGTLSSDPVSSDPVSSDPVSSDPVSSDFRTIKILEQENISVRFIIAF